MIDNDKNISEETAVQREEQTVRVNGAGEANSATRRQALSLSVMGGVTAFLAACGKYVTNYDKGGSGTVGARGSGGAGGIVPGPVTGAGDPGSGGGGEGGTATPTPTPTATPDPGTTLNPDTRPCVNPSGITFYEPVNVFHQSGAANVVALYGGAASGLFAFKLRTGASGGAPGCGSGDLVTVLARIDANKSLVVASRRVRSSDIMDSGMSVGLIFENVAFANAPAIDIIIHKSATSVYRTSLTHNDALYRRSMGGEEIYDMSLVRRTGEMAKAGQLFNEFQFGGGPLANATLDPLPSMSSTSAISNGQSLSGLVYGGSYTAATTSSQWNISSLIPAVSGQILDRKLTNIFGEELTIPSGNSNILQSNQSLVVYLKKTKTVQNMNSTKWLRYFVNIG